MLIVAVVPKLKQAVSATSPAAPRASQALSLAAAIIGVPDARWGETGKAVLVLKPGQHLAPETVISHCLKNLAKFKVPNSVSFIDALPRNATGKVLKRSLREQFVGQDAPAIS